MGTCNRGWRRWPCDVVFAMDRDQVGEAALEAPASVVASKIRADQWRQSNGGKVLEFVVASEEDCAWSAGTLGFRWLLRHGAASVTLIGFDGDRDPRSLFHGEPGYQQSAPAPRTCRDWHDAMVSFSATLVAPRAVYLVLPDRAPHPLDRIPAWRVVDEDLVTHLEGL